MLGNYWRSDNLQQLSFDQQFASDHKLKLFFIVAQVMPVYLLN